eukprot:TRINITY_DN4318_c0_g1_i1.p1 TRINITY_DN4318_c0_g1~~TRINITY_DN4318_c0_g1_i1.p1  ORF type:complete len:327 (+),score=34.18 TRINITY_DN4318_c0_g1_i1:92-982(+)
MTANREDDTYANFKMIPGLILDRILTAADVQNHCSCRRINQKTNQSFCQNVTKISPKFSAFLHNFGNSKNDKVQKKGLNMISKNSVVKTDQQIVECNSKKQNEEVVIQLKKLEVEVQPQKKSRQKKNLLQIVSHPIDCSLEDFHDDELFQISYKPNFKQKTVNYQKFSQISSANLLNLQITPQIDSVTILKIQYNLLNLIQDLKNIMTVIVDNHQLNLLSKFCGINCNRQIKIQIQVDQKSSFEDMCKMGRMIQKLHQFKCIQTFEIEIDQEWLFVSGWLPPRLTYQKMHMKIIGD